MTLVAIATFILSFRLTDHDRLGGKKNVLRNVSRKLYTWSILRIFQKIAQFQRIAAANRNSSCDWTFNSLLRSITSSVCRHLLMNPFHYSFILTSCLKLNRKTLQRKETVESASFFLFLVLRHLFRSHSTGIPIRQWKRTQRKTLTYESCYHKNCWIFSLVQHCVFN